MIPKVIYYQSFVPSAWIQLQSAFGWLSVNPMLNLFVPIKIWDADLKQGFILVNKFWKVSEHTIPIL